MKRRPADSREHAAVDWKSIDAAREKASEPFMQESRWGLLPVLMWIATRNPAMTHEVSHPDTTFSRAGMLAVALHACSGQGSAPANAFSLAWDELASRAQGGTLLAAANRVNICGDDVSGVIRGGQVFPPADEPLAWHTYAVFETKSGILAVVPKRYVGRGSTEGFSDISFDRRTITSLWNPLDKPFATSAPVGRPRKTKADEVYKSLSASERTLTRGEQLALINSRLDAKNRISATTFKRMISDENKK